MTMNVNRCGMSLHGKSPNITLYYIRPRSPEVIFKLFDGAILAFLLFTFLYPIDLIVQLYRLFSAIGFTKFKPLCSMNKGSLTYRKTGNVEVNFNGHIPIIKLSNTTEKEGLTSLHILAAFWLCLVFDRIIQSFQSLLLSPFMDMSLTRDQTQIHPILVLCHGFSLFQTIQSRSTKSLTFSNISMGVKTKQYMCLLTGIADHLR